MELFEHIFAFNPNSPLLFTQFYFWAFFAIVYLLFALIVEGTPALKERTRLHLRNIFLMFVSWFFYYKTSGSFLLILIVLTLTNWSIAFGIRHALDNNRTWAARIWMGLSVTINLAFLFYYKYAYFGVDVFNSVFGSHYSIVNQILLPVGISFYTFQVISYTVDIFRGTVKPVTNIFDFGFYVSFFPQLVAGPIVRASEFVPQLYMPFHLSRRLFGLAVFWIVNGLAKKIILSDYLAVNLIDRVFDNPLLFSGFENLFALFAYSLQVYADFSGYTDIATGVAMLMGFYLPRNFDSPYKSRNPQEFWRRWHQSLSRWLKSYVYIPLGGNRTIFGRKVPKLLASNVNSFATMLIGGLWHGASWNFVIWGGLNGVGMIVNKIWRELGWYIRALLMTGLLTGLIIWRSVVQVPLLNLACVWVAILWVGTMVRFFYWWLNVITRREKLIGGVETTLTNALANVWAILQTFAFITFTRLFFRSSSNLDPASASETAWQTAVDMIGQIGGAWNNGIILPFLSEYWKVVALFLAGMIIHWLPTDFKRRYRIAFASLPIPVMIIAVCLVIFVIYQFVTADMQPFIYFQF